MTRSRGLVRTASGWIADRGARPPVRTASGWIADREARPPSERRQDGEQRPVSTDDDAGRRERWLAVLDDRPLARAQPDLGERRDDAEHRQRSERDVRDAVGLRVQRVLED